MSLIAAFNFDVDGADATGNGFDISIASPSLITPSGHTNGGLTQSTSGLFTGPADLLAAVKTPNRTFMAWVKETSSVTAWVLELHNSSIDSGTWGLLFLSGQWNIQARNASGFVRASVARPTDGLFHHVAGTYDGVNVRLYLDGTLVATQPLTAPLRTDADGFRIQDQSGSAVTIDDVRFFDEALDQATISALMATPVTAGRSGKPKTWSGSLWNLHQAKVWSGSSWDPVPIAGYDGSNWIPSK